MHYITLHSYPYILKIKTLHYISFHFMSLHYITFHFIHPSHFRRGTIVDSVWTMTVHSLRFIFSPHTPIMFYNMLNCTCSHSDVWYKLWVSHRLCGDIYTIFISDLVVFAVCWCKACLLQWVFVCLIAFHKPC